MVGRGTYALVLRCRERALVRVGALGDVELLPGYLVYVGSAFGSGGLAGRLRHHVRSVKRPRWHVDYVRGRAETVGAWWAAGARNLEHEWAGSIAQLPGASVPKAGLGSSDCRCPSHLFRLPRSPRGGWFAAALGGCGIAPQASFVTAADLLGSPPRR